ncbi:16S rRNA (cytidine(1402)-2'-O)-methyltransferase [Patescibacteria group bacterium]|nr:16S rRNA (cytidine(1402)-2'-O)-methyltransferase [Patescibacteria group bacterium]
MTGSSVFYIVSTPIGNLEDITHRAVRILREVDMILCEDTRTTQKLLDHYYISTPTQSYHAHSSAVKENDIITRIIEGKTFALVSDAGTPTISDPGVKLVTRIRSDVPLTQIIPIPGVTALITALSITGFGGNQFTFYGFLPHKKGRASIFDQIAESERVSVFYESPHRLLKTLKELAERFGTNRDICVARELTKIHEETPIFNAQEMYHYYLNDPSKVRGECVIIINK